MVRKQSRAHITTEIEGFILWRALERPYGDRTTLAESLQKEIYRKFGKNPSIETLEKKISYYRNHIEDDPQEKPWSIATLDAFPIPPQALPIVLKEFRRRTDEGGDFTIRQAKWVARLSATDYVKALSYQIAKVEQIYSIIGRPPDFEIYDKLLVGLPGISRNWQVPFMATASLAGILKNDPTKRNKNKEGAHGREGGLQAGVMKFEIGKIKEGEHNDVTYSNDHGPSRHTLE